MTGPVFRGFSITWSSGRKSYAWQYRLLFISNGNFPVLFAAALHNGRKMMFKYGTPVTRIKLGDRNRAGVPTTPVDVNFIVSRTTVRPAIDGAFSFCDPRGY